MRVRWTTRGESDLAEIVTYVARDDVDAAIRLEDRILAGAQQLETFPNQGRLGRREGTRELVIVGTPYFVVYALEGDAAVVLHVVHGARDWP